jgi:hypothetical protein
MPADAKCIHFGTFSNETQSVGNYVKLPALCSYNCYAIHTSLLPTLMAHIFDDVRDVRVEGLYGLALNGVKGCVD